MAVEEQTIGLYVVKGSPLHYDIYSEQLYFIRKNVSSSHHHHQTAASYAALADLIVLVSA